MGCGLGVDEIADRFGRRQVELTVFKAPPREFARLRQTTAIDSGQDCKYSSDYRRAAMEMEFGHIFAGKAAGCGKPHRQGAVDDLGTVMDHPQRRLARRRTGSARQA